MIIEDVCVLGGSGAVGRHICRQLVAAGYRVTVPTRHRERSKELILLPTAHVVDADVHDLATLRRVTRGAHAVVNLVGVLHDGRGRSSFREAHIELARKVAEACRANGIRRLLHMSALNADAHAPSAYLRSRGEAERIVRESGLDFTIFRPSVVFGPEDRFLNLFARLLRVMPVLFLGSPDARFQPIYVQDVAAAFVASLTRLDSLGASFDLVGPRVYTLRELVLHVGEMTGRRRPVIGLGDRLSYWQAYAMEFSPVKVLTRDNYLSMKVDNVSGQPLPFGLRATPLEAVAPAWLGRRTPRLRYQALRDRSNWQP